MAEETKESDWKLYSSRVDQWRERYLKRKNKEIAAQLLDEAKTPTERFWDARKMMKEEADMLSKCLGGHSRSRMFTNLLQMFHHGLIQDADLEGFGEPLRRRILDLFKEIGR